MKLWNKKGSVPSANRGVARAASAGASRGEWMQEAVHMLAESGDADRVGIWLEPEPAKESAAGGAFRGLVWDRDSQGLPLEWRQLSPEAPLPPELLAAAGSVEIDFAISPEQAILGPHLELRRALWVPVESHGRLRGMLLAGSKRRTFAIPRRLPELVAAELALALEREEEQRLAQDRQADLAVTRQMLQALGAADSVDTALAQLAESCVNTGSSSPGAIFVAIGRLDDSGPAPIDDSATVAAVNFLWNAGEKTSFAALQDPPFLEIWRAAIANRRVVGSAVHLAFSQGMAGRAVAIPMESHGRLLGVLLAGLPGSVASLATLQRLELRAALAAAFLLRRNQAAEQHLHSDEQRRALESSSHPAVLLDAHGSILEISRSAQELLAEPDSQRSAPPASLLSEPLVRFFRASEQHRVARWLQRQIAPSGHRPPVDKFLEAQLHNGRRARLHPFVSSSPSSVVLLLENAGAPQPPGALESAEIELRNVIEWLEEGVVLFDAHGNIRAMNIRFEQMAGLSAEESGKYRTLEALIERLEPQAAEPPEFAERWRALARGMEGGIREELQMVQPIPRILERSARPILDGIGRSLGRVEIYRDLTAQRIFQSKLLQTEKLAAVGQMLTGVAHELSNPLTTILGYAQRLLTRKDGNTEEARKIYQEAERAGRILKQLLAHARETSPERRSISLNHIVLRAMELQRFSLAAEKIRVELNLDPVLPFVRGDAGQLQQVLMNLLGNARQAVEQQGRGGTIRVRTAGNEHGQVTLVVQDTGPGIPQGILARIFDPFFTTKPAGIGTGLGLSIVLSIVREHGGRVHVTSPPGSGAHFTVELPAISVPVQLQADESEPSAPRETFRDTPGRPNVVPAPAVLAARKLDAISNGHAGRVLVVEDEPTVARLIADVLEDEGFEVSVLLDGREALERATHEVFDLVICDMKMPGLDGQTFYKSLVRMGSPLGDRFLFVTGDSIGPHTQAFLTHHHLPCLSKPFRVEELTEHVRQTLANRSPASARAAVAAKKQ
jgi:signal transduction histidine kinase/CheY-like chemotaxis protein